MGKCIRDFVSDHVNNSALEEDLKRAGEVSPDVSMDVEVDIAAIDIDGDINGSDFRNNSSRSQSLGTEGKSHANGNLVHVDLNVAGSDEEKPVGSEGISLEDSRKVVAGKDESVVGNIGLKDDILGILRD